jgi:predicted RecB family nuclease
VRLGNDPRQAEQMLRDLQQLRDGGPPRLLLNDHCTQCEFRRQCHGRAVREESLSLLRGMSEPEIRRHNDKGIFTVRQLSYTFRHRRRNRRARSQASPRSFALQALAIRANQVHVHGSFAVPAAPASLYRDIEGLPDRGSYDLIGLLVVDNGVEGRHSFWVDKEAEQPAAFSGLLEALGRYPNYRLFHSGDYEPEALRRIKARLPEDEQEQVDVVLGRAVNVLSIIHAHVYFPAYSCGLKDIGRCPGCDWSEPDASGLQSVAWRTAWERSRDESLKAKLVRYNLEDCLALRAVTEFLAGGFSTPLREVVETIDRYGLKKRHLHKHRAEVEAFVDEARAGEARSEVARGYRRRFEKYRGKLFAFLDHDGVPWNNNNAGHAIKCFASTGSSRTGGSRKRPWATTWSC